MEYKLVMKTLTPFHICQPLAAFLTSESCGVAKAKAPCLKYLLKVATKGLKAEFKFNLCQLTQLFVKQIV